MDSILSRLADRRRSGGIFVGGGGGGASLGPAASRRLTSMLGRDAATSRTVAWSRRDRPSVIGMKYTALDDALDAGVATPSTTRTPSGDADQRRDADDERAPTFLSDYRRSFSTTPTTASTPTTPRRSLPATTP